MVFSFHKCSVAVYRLGKTEWVVRLIFRTHNLIGRRHPFLTVLYKNVIIYARHDDVHIVIPGDKAFVTHCSKHCACGKAIAQVVLPAYFVYCFKYFQKMLLERSYIVGCHFQTIML